jgi:hypothetical protein
MNKEDVQLIDNLPDSIHVDSSVLKARPGSRTTLEKRRASSPVNGKVQGKRQHYSEKEKLNAVCVFAVAGNSRRVAEITKIPEVTIRGWKTTVWWNEAMSRIYTEQDEELNTKLTKLVNKAVDNINDRLDSGDWVYNPKMDKLIRKPVNAKDLAVVTAISLDKRQLLRGQPTSRIEKVSNDERMQALADQFKKFAMAKTIEHDDSLNVIEREEC